ncbi:MAG: HD domain-containing protein [Bacteroidia bacterium]
MEFEAAESFILAKLKNELPGNLYYHSYSHVMDVLDAAVNYAKMENISDYETQLLKTAVLFHDSGFTVQSKNHEEIGCEIVRAELPKYNYTNEEIEKICGMIMATRIPQSPTNKLEEIICDADLDYLGRDDFWTIGSNLFKELEIYGILSDEKDWNKLQLKFLSSHKYFTKSALSLRKEKKDQHTQKIQEIVNSYQ